MDKIRYRDLQRWNLADIKQALPLAITQEGQSVMVLLDISDYNKLVRRVRHDSPAYEIDADGPVIYEE